MRVQTGENVGIGGFIICGSEPKHLALRALGPSLTKSGVPGALTDPVLELRDSYGNLRRANDNWKDDPAQRALIAADGLAPSDDRESAMDVILDPGAYTAIVRGKSNATGIGLVEVYDLDDAAASKLANISTRAIVGTGENVVIAGFVLGGESSTETVAVRGIGPSLGLTNVLADPILELFDSAGNRLETNNDWQDNATQAMQLRNAGLAPSDTHESGIVRSLAKGTYTAVLGGFNNAAGVGLVEVYSLGSSAAPVEVTVSRVQTGTAGAIEKQHVSFSPSRCAETFTISVYKPLTINHSNIGSRAALQGETSPIPFSASAEDIEAALLAIPRYYAYGQFGDLEFDEGSFDYFASVGAINREPIVKLDVEGGTAADGFTIEFGSLVGSQTQYNTWVAGIPDITIEIR